jgi:hypothetical protein
MDNSFQKGLPGFLSKTAIHRKGTTDIVCWRYPEVQNILDWIDSNNLVIFCVDVYENDEEMRYTGYRWSYQGNPSFGRKYNLSSNLVFARNFVNNASLKGNYCYELLFKQESDIDEIEWEFLDSAIINRGEILFSPKDSISIISRCREKQKVILGIEAFLVEKTENGQTIQPNDYMVYVGKNYVEYPPDKYLEVYHTKKNADFGHYEEATEWIKDREKNGWHFEINCK